MSLAIPKLLQHPRVMGKVGIVYGQEQSSFPVEGKGLDD
jgi:ribosomal protein L21E